MNFLFLCFIEVHWIQCVHFMRHKNKFSSPSSLSQGYPLLSVILASTHGECLMRSTFGKCLPWWEHSWKDCPMNLQAVSKTTSAGACHHCHSSKCIQLCSLLHSPLTQTRARVCCVFPYTDAVRTPCLPWSHDDLRIK